MTTSSTVVPAPPTVPGRRRAVPWATVLPLAVVLAYADGFWVTSMRGAVGAVGRGQGPYTTWWHESSVVVPFYVCAVLGALALAVHVSDRRRGGGRTPLLLAAGLVVVAATLVGFVEMAVGAAYDFHLQSGQLEMMSSMRGDCRADCIERLRADTWWLQVRATGVGTGLLLLTNLGAVAWVTMFLGGRLDTVRPSRARGGWAAVVGGRRLLLAAALAGGALIHVAVVPEHLEEWVAAAWFFVALTLVQAAAAVLVLRGPVPDRLALLLVAATSVGPLVVWVWSRVWGLPFGPDPGVPEAVGLPDCAAGVLELLALVLAVALLRRGAGDPDRAVADRRPRTEHLSRLALTAVLAVTLLGVAASQQGWFDIVRSENPASSEMG